MKQSGRLGFIFALALLASHPAAAQRRTLDIYFIDVEGGQSTLVVTPGGQTLLIDTGFPGDGTFASLPGDPHKARDANRILAAAHAAGVKRIDYLLITHFHADHDGAVPELAQLMPIRTFVDHEPPGPEAEARRRHAGGLRALRAGTRQGQASGAEAGRRHPAPRRRNHRRQRRRRDDPEAAGRGGRRQSGVRAAPAPAAQEPTENPRSTGVRLRFGRFTFLDVGDLSGAPLFALACPNNLIGPTDAYLVAHHGGPDAAVPATFAAFAPRVAIVNNGKVKGGSPELLVALHEVSGLDDAWQLHRSLPPGPRYFTDDHIANLDESTAHWLKLSAKSDGSFTITNGRTGASKAYGPRGATRPSAPAAPK